MYCRLLVVMMSLPLAACNQSSDEEKNSLDLITSETVAFQGTFGPDDAAYIHPDWPHGSNSNANLALRSCSATGATFTEAADRYAAQCDLPRSDCDPVGSEWVCSSAEIINEAVVNDSGVNNSAVVNNTQIPLPPYQSPSTSLQPVDPATREQESYTERPGYELVFSDEFNAGEINAERWNTQLLWDGEFNGERYEYRIINGESQFYVNPLSDDQEHLDEVVPLHNPFELNGERLAIRATVNPRYRATEGLPYGAMDDIVAQQPFLSGAMSSYNKFSQRNGYFEARIKLPSTVGTFPAFWLFHQRRISDGTFRSEIDIMENLGHAPWFVYNSYHYHYNVTETYSGDANFLVPDPSGQVYTGIDYSENYHVYAVEWDPERISWFIDGEKVSELVSDRVDLEEMYIILNLAIGGNWVNFPTTAGGLGRPDSERFPTTEETRAENFSNPALEIDYVRAYRRN